METSQNISKSSLSSKDLFLYLGVTLSLYVSVISILVLLFSIIDQVFPKQFEYMDPYVTGASGAIAMLLVAFPLCLFLAKIISKEEFSHPEKLNLWIRKAFSYGTLFVVTVAIAINLIVLLESFFGGEEITLAFGMKVLSVLVILAIVASYCLYNLRKKEGDGLGTETKYAYGATLLVVFVIIAGFLVMGSPSTQKKKRFDAERVTDLDSIQYSILNYWQTKEKLPVTLKDLDDPLYGFTAPLDPRSFEPYEYVTTGPLSFKLCAIFERESLVTLDTKNYPVPIYQDEHFRGITGNWQHVAGKTCFDRNIDKDRYPVQK